VTDLIHPLAASFRLEGEEPEAFLMLHGWTGSPAHFRLAAQFVNDRGFTVSVPRLAGHGTSLHHMMDTGSSDWVRSALEGLFELRDDHHTVHVVGLSMGGTIGLLMAATCDIASVTTINAPQRLHSRRVRLAKLRRRSRRIRQGIPSEPPVGAAADFWVQYGSSPVGTVSDLLDLMDAARAALSRVRVPAVIVQSHADETVHPESARIIYDGLGSIEKRIVWLDRSRHVALLDTERDRIHQAIIAQVGAAGRRGEFSR